jgi:membrane-bound lytic murein transglycosylase D
MRRSFWWVLGSVLAGILFIQLFTNWRTVGDAGREYMAAFRAHYGIYALSLPGDLSFAGEPVPMYLADVQERFDRELLVNTYWQSQTLLFFKRANRWFPLIEPILAAHGVPKDFKYLALIESGLMNVVSPAGAAGFWQIMEGTGRDLGLEINSHVDERYHLEKATAAACRYLIDARERFGSWTMAAAAYNIGNARLSRIIDNQKVESYYDLFLNDETSRYVFRMLAVKHIFEDPQASGFHFMEEDLYLPYQYTVTEVDTTITDLSAFAFGFQTNYKEMRLMNPWLRSYDLPKRSGKTYLIKIPVTNLEQRGDTDNPDEKTETADNPSE